jgi:hypothetical protein
MVHSTRADENLISQVRGGLRTVASTLGSPAKDLNKKP